MAENHSFKAVFERTNGTQRAKRGKNKSTEKDIELGGGRINRELNQ